MSCKIEKIQIGNHIKITLLISVWDFILNYNTDCEIFFKFF